MRTDSGWEWVRGDLKDEDSERLEGRGDEEGGEVGGEVSLVGGEVMGEALQDGHPADVRDVRCSAQAHAGEDRVPRWGWVWQRYGLWGWWRRRCGGGHFSFLYRNGYRNGIHLLISSVSGLGWQ